LLIIHHKERKEHKERKLMSKKAKTEEVKGYDLVIKIHGAMASGKTFASHKIGALLAENGCLVELSEAGQLTGVRYGQHLTSTRRVLIDTSLRNVHEVCKRCGKTADYLIREKYTTHTLFACKGCTKKDELYSGDVVMQVL